MGKDESGWDFVLIPNPSSTYKKLKSLKFVAFDRRRGANPIKVRISILCLRSY